MSYGGTSALQGFHMPTSHGFVSGRGGKTCIPESRFWLLSARWNAQVRLGFRRPVDRACAVRFGSDPQIRAACLVLRLHFKRPHVACRAAGLWTRPTALVGVYLARCPRNAVDGRTAGQERVRHGWATVVCERTA
jgi:hypothetical protein